MDWSESDLPVFGPRNVRSKPMRFFRPRRDLLVAALALMVGAALAVASPSRHSAAASSAHEAAAPHAAGPVRLPLDFVENRGQWPAPVVFGARRGAVAAGFTRRTVELSLRNGRST